MTLARLHAICWTGTNNIIYRFANNFPLKEIVLGDLRRRQHVIPLKLYFKMKREVDREQNIYLPTRLANIPGLWKLAGTSRTAELINTPAPLRAPLQLHRVPHCLYELAAAAEATQLWFLHPYQMFFSWAWNKFPADSKLHQLVSVEISLQRLGQNWPMKNGN